jgi:hypothetical protein
MKRSLPVLIFLLFSGLTCRTQSLSLLSENTGLPNGSHIYQSGRSDTIQLINWLHIVNVSDQRLEVLMKKEDVSLLPGASSSICWAGFCYDSAVTVSVFPLDLPAGDTSSGCFGHYAPRGGKGESVVRWTFFTVANPSDSVSVTAHFATYPAAAGSMAGRDFRFHVASQVPADDHAAFRLSLPPGSNARIELHNAAGITVACNNDLHSSGRVAFDTEEMPAGLYLAILFLDGQPVATRKVPVVHPGRSR